MSEGSSEVEGGPSVPGGDHGVHLLLPAVGQGQGHANHVRSETEGAGSVIGSLKASAY